MDCFSLFVGDDLCDFIAVEAIWMRGEIRVQSVCENFVDVVWNESKAFIGIFTRWGAVHELRISSYRVTDNLYEKKQIQRVMTKNRSEEVSCFFTSTTLWQNCRVVDRLFKRFQTRLVNNITWKTSSPLPFSRTKISPKMLVWPFRLISSSELASRKINFDDEHPGETFENRFDCAWCCVTLCKNYCFVAHHS